MDNQLHTDSADALRADASERRDLLIPLNCPACETSGRVGMRQLPHLMHCPACGSSFWVGRDGQIHSDRDKPAVRMPCPRCGGVNQLPAEIMLKTFRCSFCGFEAPREEPGNRTKQPSATCGQSATLSATVRSDKSIWTPERAWRLVWIVVPCVVIICAALCVWWYYSSRLDGQLVRAVSGMMIATVRGDDTAALDWTMPDGELDYRRWVKTDFGQAIGSAKIGGDAWLELHILKKTPPRIWLEVTLHGAGDSNKRFRQAWRQTEDGDWRFDAKATFDRYRKAGRMSDW